MNAQIGSIVFSRDGNLLNCQKENLYFKRLPVHHDLSVYVYSIDRKWHVSLDGQVKDLNLPENSTRADAEKAGREIITVIKDKEFAEYDN